MSNEKKLMKKPYSFGEYEVMDFTSLVSSYAPELNNLAIYARIPIMTGDCSDGSGSGGYYANPADLCMAPTDPGMIN